MTECPKPRRRRMKPKKGDIPKWARDFVRARSGGRCEIRRPDCLGPADQQHHKKKRSQGGSHDPINLVDTCQNCHEDVENMRPGTGRWRTKPWQDEGLTEEDLET